MAHCIIIRGPAGIGKTTIAKLLAKDLDAEYISLDDILHEKDLDHVEGICIKEENFLRVNDVVIPKMNALMRKGKNVILDGNFYHKNHLKELIRASEFPVQVFTLKAKVDDCISRDSARTGEDKIGEKNIRQVHALVSKWDYGTAIDIGKKSAKETAAEILRKLRTPARGGAAQAS